MNRNEPLPLYLVTHQGELAVNDHELIASRTTSEAEAGQSLESLVEMTRHQAESLLRMVNVTGVALAPPGDFRADDGTMIHIGDDGSWHRPHGE